MSFVRNGFRVKDIEDRDSEMLLTSVVGSDLGGFCGCIMLFLFSIVAFMTGSADVDDDIIRNTHILKSV